MSVTLIIWLNYKKINIYINVVFNVAKVTSVRYVLETLNLMQEKLQISSMFIIIGNSLWQCEIFALDNFAISTMQSM